MPPDGPPEATVLAPASVRYAGGAAADGRADTHVIAANNRWARAMLDFRGLRPGVWATLALQCGWDAGETAAHAADFALVGFDFLARDGSSLDLDHVPGLTRTLLHPHGAWIAGPAYHGGGETRAAILRFGFRVPAQAGALTVTLRSWRNARPFTLGEAAVHLGPSDADWAPLARRRLGPARLELCHPLVPRVGLVVRGQLYADRPDGHAAQVRLAYRDAQGVPIAPPYPGVVSVPGLGAVINLAAHRQTRRFTLDLTPPPEAATVVLDFGGWADAPAPPEVEFLSGPDVALEDRLRLERLCGDDLLDAPAFLARLAAALGLPPASAAAWAPEAASRAAGPGALALARRLRDGPEPLTARDAPDGPPTLRAGGAPDWTVPDAPDWREDPFRSVPWRLAYQSLAWLQPLAERPRTRARAVALALSWSRANPWGQPADPLGLHPATLAVRAEILAWLCASGGADAAALSGEVARHGFALAEIVGQNTLARSLPGIQAAAALLAVAGALPRLPLAAHWTSLARESLRAGFEALLGPDAAASEGSLHRRLDLVSHGRALGIVLGEAAPGPGIAARAAAALPALADLLDPGGRLPPFGDSPHGVDHAAWIARLSSGSPAGPAAARDDAGSGDLVTARHAAPGRGWSHFACTLAEQAPQGHRDCTSFVFATRGLRWIVEGGGSEAAETGAVRHYLLSPRAHNVAVPDGREPVAGRGRCVARIGLDGATAYRIETTVHGPDYRHVRIFVLPDDLGGLAVLDRFAAADRPVAFEGLLHLAPEALVGLSGARRAMAHWAGRRLDIVTVAVDGRATGLELAFGRDDSPATMQGLVSDGPGALRPAGVLRYAFAGEGRVAGGLIVAADSAAEARLQRLLDDPRLARHLAAP